MLAKTECKQHGDKKYIFTRIANFLTAFGNNKMKRT